ncbi:MAG: SPFH domain-containing protein [Bifidobacteriaceae bacterium]|jgi:regulator of protease activity HflC (stomatin/prohibitin superfamily)|nr:SPFH domain-containing protein [Bifidobacteriaceae bacterium]
MATSTTASSTRDKREPTAELTKPVGGVEERAAWTWPGWAGILVVLILILGGGALMVLGLAGNQDRPGLAACVAGVVVLVIGGVMSSGLAIIWPGYTKVLVFFGSYVGTVRKPGLWLTMPLTVRQLVSIRVHNFETNELKVNDSDGNPVNVAAIVVWQVADTAEASFAVEDYNEFVAVQSEAALRHVTMAHPYDGPDSSVTLRGSTEEISAELAREVAARVKVAGVAIIEVRISKLSYAPEIAEAMLRRQQAGAIIAAREKIVEGAVSVVHEALRQLEGEGTVQLDDERRAAMVSNLLVVLTSDQQVSPVINTGSLYT